MNHQQLSTSTDVPAWPANALPERWIESLFERMHLAYGTRFADQWRGTDPRALQRYWAEKLGTLTADELKAGVAKLDSLDWPPTLPQFLKLCRPGVDPVAAYYEAVAGVQARERGEVGTWSHPAVYWTAVKIGAFDLKNHGYAALKARWERELSEQLRRDTWPEISVPAQALPAPGRSELSREKAAAMLKQLGAEGVLNQDRVDHKRWAKRILARIAAGEQVLLVQAQMAREALAAPDFDA